MPAASTAPISRYGFAVASKHFSSAFADDPVTSRSAVSRVSCPHACQIPAHRDGRSRRNDTGCPQPIATSAGSSRSTPARNASPSVRSPHGPSPPVMSDPAASCTDRCRWAPDPAPSGSTDGENDARHPCARLRDRTVCRTSTASSAAPTGSFGATDTSSCATAYSGWNCSTVSPCAVRSATSSAAYAATCSRRINPYAGPSNAGVKRSAPARPRIHSCSNAASACRPCPARASVCRAANARWHATNRVPSWSYLSAGTQPQPGCADSATRRVMSGVSRRSPSGPPR
jgi:hypothetical protein